MSMEEDCLVQYRWPVGVCAFDETGNVGFPIALNLGVEVKVELAIDNLPVISISLCGVALTHGPGAVAAILRGVGIWFGEKGVEVFLAGEAELSALVFRGEGPVAFDRFTLGKVSDGVMPLHGQIVEQARVDRSLVGVGGRRGQGCGGRCEQGGGEHLFQHGFGPCLQG